MPPPTKLSTFTRLRDRIVDVDYHLHTSVLQRARATLYLLWRAVTQSDLLSRASSLAFTLLLALIPLFATTLAFFTAFPGLQSQRDKLTGVLFAQLLPGAVASIQQHIAGFADRAAAAGAVSSLAFLVVILMLFQSLETTVNRMWRVARDRTWGERLQSLALFFTTGAIAATAFVALQTAPLGFLASISQALIFHVTSVVVAWVAFTIFNKWIPNTHVRWKPAIIAALVCGTLWHGLKTLFTLYVERLADYENIYGVIGVVPAFFLWVQLSLTATLLSTKLAFILQNLTPLMLTLRAERTGHSRAYFAVSVAAVLARAFREGEVPVRVEEIALRLKVAPFFVAEAVASLATGSVILASAGVAQELIYSLAKPAESIRLVDIVSLVTREPLSLPVTKHTTLLHDHIGALFVDARSPDGNVLARITLAELVNDAPHVERSEPDTTQWKTPSKPDIRPA